MRCPKCKCEKTKVMDTMPGCNNNVFRRRKCTNCDTLFRTVECIYIGNHANNLEYRDAYEAKSTFYKNIRLEKENEK